MTTERATLTEEEMIEYSTTARMRRLSAYRVRNNMPDLSEDERAAIIGDGVAFPLYSLNSVARHEARKAVVRRCGDRSAAKRDLERIIKQKLSNVQHGLRTRSEPKVGWDAMDSRIESWERALEFIVNNEL